MNMSELIRQFKYCPICTEKLLKNPYYREAGAVYCPEHGDFFIERGRGGLENSVVFQPFKERRRWNVSYRNGRPGYLIKCNQTGIIYPSIKKAAEDLGLSRGNLSNHINGSSMHTHVKGYTFSLVNPDQKADMIDGRNAYYEPAPRHAVDREGRSN